MKAPQKRRSPREAGNEECLGGRSNSITNTTANAQRSRLLKHLRRGSIDTIAARRDLNVMHPAMRIKELRDAGHNIATIRVNRVDDQGRKHQQIALYVLKGGAR